MAPVFSITWEYHFHIANKSAAANETKPYIYAFLQAALLDSALSITLEDLSKLNLNFL
jgi:hypothetical protein